MMFDFFNRKRVRELEALLQNRDDRLEAQTELIASIRTAISETRVTNMAVARMIAAMDPMYRKSELSPERKAKSDQIGDEILRRLWAEDAARKHSLGEPIGPAPKTKA